MTDEEQNLPEKVETVAAAPEVEQQPSVEDQSLKAEAKEMGWRDKDSFDVVPDKWANSEQK